MKTKYNALIGLAFSLFIFASCEKVIEFKGEFVKPLLVVNGFITPDSAIKVQISKSRFFLSKEEMTFDKVTDAKVSLYINNGFVKTIAHTENGMYISTIKPLAGDIVRIKVEKEGETTVETETTVPLKVYITKVDTLSVKVVNENSSGNYFSGYENIETKMLVNFNDAPNERNYYRLTMQTITHYEDRTVKGSGYISSDDIVFGGTLSNPLDEGSISTRYFEFSDDLFNGKAYALKITNNRMEYKNTEDESNKDDDDPTQSKTPINTEYVLQLQSISRDYFFYLRSLNANSNSSEFFSEPVQIHSNVNNGIGIWGSYNLHEYKAIVNTTNK